MTTKADLLKRYGSEAAISAHYRDMQKKSRITYTGNGGFRHMKKNNPERFKQISSKGGKSVKAGNKG